nr:hypothetical protein [Bacteroidota bacterium]
MFFVLITFYSNCKKDDNTSSDSCQGISAVDYEDQTYNNVAIGTQCWFKENLNVGTMIHSMHEQKNNGIIEKYCYANDTSNCTKFGGLCNWDGMMNYSKLEAMRGICPEGWYPIAVNLRKNLSVEHKINRNLLEIKLQKLLSTQYGLNHYKVLLD